MKIHSVIQSIYRLIKGGPGPGKLQSLKHQQFLLHEGMETSAEVMETSFMEDKVGSMLPVKLWVKLKKADGSFIYTHTQTIVPLNMVPRKGQKLRVKYLPGNLSSILILAIIPG
jgi:hypothetical protein